MARRPRAEFEITARDRARGVLNNVDRSLQKLTRTAVVGSRALGGLGVGIGLSELAQMTDRYNALTIRIRTATKETGDFARVQRELISLASDTGTGLESTVDTFQALSRVREDIGATNEQMIGLTRVVQQLGVIGGTSTEALRNGLRQFNQGIAAGVFRAEEFNSIVENTPEIAKRLADGFEVSQGALRQMVIDGQLFSNDVMNVLLAQAPEISGEFEDIPITLDRAFSDLGTSIGTAASELDSMLGVTGGIAGGLTNLAKEIRLLSGTASNVELLQQQQESLQRQIDETTQRLTGLGATDKGRESELFVRMSAELDALRAKAQGTQAAIEFFSNPDLGQVGGGAGGDDELKKIDLGLLKQQRRAAQHFEALQSAEAEFLAQQSDLRLRSTVELAQAISDEEDRLRTEELARLLGFEDEKSRLLFDRGEQDHLAVLDARSRRFEELLAQELGFEDARHQQLIQAEEEFERRKIEAKFRNNPLAKKAALDLLNFDKKTATEKTKFVLGQASQLTQGLATTSRAAFNINKGAASAEAIINIATGVTRAFRDLPFPAAIAAAAAVSAAGAAQLATIQGTSFGGASSGFTGGGAGSGVPSFAGESPLREIPLISSENRNDSQITIRVVGDGEVAGALIEGMAFEIDQGDLQVVREGSRQAIDLGDR